MIPANMQIECRPIRRQDYDALAQIIRSTWNYDRFCSPKVAKCMGRLYLAACLTQATYTQVAEAEGKPIGVILAKSNMAQRPAPLRLRFFQLRATAALLSTREGRGVAKQFEQFSAIDQTLLNGCKLSFQGEVVLFALAQQARGQGLGKRLFHLAQDYFCRAGVKRFYLYTDTTCNYPFYEKQGMIRAGEQQLDLRPVFPTTLGMFLYASPEEGPLAGEERHAAGPSATPSV